VTQLPNFDDLVKLAKTDPEALEAFRQQAIEDLINSAPVPHQRRLRGLQFQVDMERQKAKNPLDSCVRISRMMHDSFAKLRDALNEAQKSHVTQLKDIINKKAKRSQAAPPIETTPLANIEPLGTNVLQFPGS